jgi:hypothetical protein
MPRPHPATVRHEILTLRSQGLTLTEIASQLRLPYGSVRRICRQHRLDPSRSLSPDYSRCGRTPSQSAQVLVQSACQMKREHPTWGAGLIRIQLIKQYGNSLVPSVRTFQQAFVRAGVNRPRRPRPQTPLVPCATEVHQVWQVDAKEQVPLAGGQRVSWLTFTDEASGALLATELSPPGALGEGPSRRDPGDVPARLHPLGIAWGHPCRQRLAIPGGRHATCPRSWHCG